MQNDTSAMLRVEYVELSGVQHGFILPENLRPCKLVGSGSAGVVLCCTTERGEMVAVKKIRSETEQGMHRALREALLMCQLQHPNLVGAEDVYLPSDIPLEHSDSALRLQRSIADYICVRMPYFPADMAWLIHSSTQALTPEHVQYILVQILRGLRSHPQSARPLPCTIFNNLRLTRLARYMHAAEVIHRDLKPSNMCDILVGEDCDVHICDFGLARRERNHLLSQYIVTRWYRPPEVLLCKRQYNKAVDIWSAGCIFAELVTRPSPHRQGLFPGFSYKDQTDKIIQMLGAPSEEDLASVCDSSDAADYVRGRFMSPPIIKNRLAAHLQEHARPGLLSAALLDLISRMLCFNPKNRITAADALRHPYFADCEEASIDDGQVAVPDDGEGKSVPQIFESLRRLRDNLREQRLQDANFVWGVWELPGM